MARKLAAVQKLELTKTAIPERSAFRTYPYISGHIRQTVRDAGKILTGTLY